MIQAIAYLWRKGFRAVYRRIAGRPLVRKTLSEAVAAQPDFLIFFSDTPANLYQLTQWLKPFTAVLDTWKTCVITMEVDTYRALQAKTDLPIIFCDRSRLIEKVIEAVEPKTIFYVNQNQGNFRMMRFARPHHVFLSHGESDKSYSSSNQIKAYDYSFVAGQAARDRLSVLRHYDVERRTLEVGRPQLDFVTPSPFSFDDDRITVLYAPTWEGDRSSMRYDSVASHGLQIVSSLINDGGYRVIYRPHPLTGSLNKDNKRADKAIRGLLKGTDHIYDRSEFGWQINAADVCIADISAISYDWLSTGKPLVMTKPGSPAVLPSARLIDELGLLPVTEAKNIPAILKNICDDDVRAQTLKELHDYYFGASDTLSAMLRFRTALDVVAR